ncbi:MAG: IDEAL domain-containing protein [Bacillota bacterium]
MENHVSNNIQPSETTMSDDIVAELLLEQILWDYKKIQILEKIDQSLQERDKEGFLRLTEVLKSVT